VVEKLRRESSFTHRVGLQGVERLKNSLEEFRVPKAQEGRHFIHATKLKVKEFVERREAKFEAFENWKFSQGWEESAQAQEEQRQPSDRLGIRSGLLVFASS
jgi:hypothetical protein